MRLLLDTHVLVWAAVTPERFDAGMKAALLMPENDLFVSIATIWEISIKIALGKLEFALDELDDLLSALAIELLPINVAHTIALIALPPFHKDPFDRMLIAQARTEGMTLMTQDDALHRYDVPIFPKPAP